MKRSYFTIIPLLVFNVAFAIGNTLYTKPIDTILLSELNPNSFNPDFKKYDQGTALFCSQIADIAYVDVPSNIYNIEDSLRSRYPEYNINIELINNPDRNIQVILFGTNKFILVAFRGTEFNKIRDVVSDAKISRWENKAEAEQKYGYLPSGHAGFRRRIMDLIDNDALFYRIEKLARSYGKTKGEIPVYLTGHSLGAAMSSMFVSPLKHKGFDFKGAYHFAPPLAISCSDATDIKNVDSSIIYDLVNYKDEVTKNFGLSMQYNHLKHIGKYYRICEDGYISRENEIFLALTKAELARGLQLTIRMHKLIHYQEALRDAKNTAALIDRRKSSGGDICFPGNDYTPTWCN